MADDVKFCPLLTIVKAGQANYMVCQKNCAFYLDDECAFITTSRILKEYMQSDKISLNQKNKPEK